MTINLKNTRTLFFTSLTFFSLYTVAQAQVIPGYNLPILPIENKDALDENTSKNADPDITEDNTTPAIEGPFMPSDLDKSDTKIKPLLQPVVGSSQMVTVKRGDTAYSLAKRAGLTVAQFLRLNNLSSPDLKVGQVVYLRRGTTHTVQPGDTLYALSRKYRVSVDALRSANNLGVNDPIHVGQGLVVPTKDHSADRDNITEPIVGRPGPTIGKAPPPLPTFPDVTPIPVTPGLPFPDAADIKPAIPSNWRETALSYLGTPYVFGGNTRNGLDCSAFVLQVFQSMGIKLPRVSRDQARVGTPVANNDLRPGDLLFFDTVGRGRISHVGIYMGDNKFINANSYRGQVTIDQLQNDKYWAPRYKGARRVL